MFDDSELKVLEELAEELESYIIFDDESEASEENDSKLEFANAIALDYEFDG